MACGEREERGFAELLSAAAMLSLSLTAGRSDRQVETLLNFVGLLEANLQFILDQRAIDGKLPPDTEILQ